MLELRAEAARFAAHLVWRLTAAALAVLALVCAIAAVVLAVPEGARWLVFTCAAVIAASGAVACFAFARAAHGASTQRRPPPAAH